MGIFIFTVYTRIYNAKRNHGQEDSNCSKEGISPVSQSQDLDQDHVQETKRLALEEKAKEYLESC